MLTLMLPGEQSPALAATPGNSLSAIKTGRYILSGMSRFSTILALVAAFLAACAAAADLPANASIERKISGRYSYTTLEERTPRGEEAFRLFVHPDGSRTMMIWHDLAAKDAQFSVVLRADASFRPQSAYVSYWVENGFKGHTLFAVTGNTVTMTNSGPAGQQTAAIEVPAKFSIGTHPVAADGWHLWYAGTDAGSSGALDLLSVEASADIAKPVLGTLVKMPYEIIGAETIETPAGRFDTTHYRLLGATDLWVHGEDRLLIRMAQPRFDRLYELVELEGAE